MGGRNKLLLSQSINYLPPLRENPEHTVSLASGKGSGSSKVAFENLTAAYSRQ